THDRADDRDALAEEESEIELCAAPCDEPDDGHAAAGGEGVEVPGEESGTDEVEDHVHAVPVGPFADDLGEVLPARVDRQFESERGGALQLPRAPARAEDVGAGGVGELERCRADATPDRVDQDSLAPS